MIQPDTNPPWAPLGAAIGHTAITRKLVAVIAGLKPLINHAVAAARRNAGAKIDQAVSFKDFHCGLLMDRCQHAKVRHHEDRVFSKFRETFWLKCIDEQHGRLMHARCMT